MFLGYTVSLTNLHIYTSTKQYTEMADVVNAIETLRHKNAFYKHIGKSMSLQGIGSFSVDYQKYVKSTAVSSYESLASQISCKKSKVINYSFVGNYKDNPHCIIASQNDNSFRKFNSAKLNTLIYTLCSNATRIKIYTAMVDLIQKYPTSIPIRLDCDALSICMLKEDTCEIGKLLKNTGFQLESSTLQGIVSLKQKSYIMLDQKTSIVKTCGLSLSLSNRFESLNYNSLAQKYFEMPDKEKCKLRLSDSKLTKNEFYEYVKSYPYGVIK